MIVLGEKGENGENILHIIIGPETETQFNFNGRSTMDIGEYLKRMDPDKPCQLIINSCNSEEEVLNMMAFHEGQRRARQIMEKLNQHPLDEESNENGFGFVSPENKSKKKPTLQNTDKKSSGITCPLCLNKNSAIIKDGMVYPCSKCQEIEEGLKSKDIPSSPGTAKLEDIRKEIQDECPQQRESIERFLRNQDDEDEEEDIIDADESE